MQGHGQGRSPLISTAPRGCYYRLRGYGVWSGGLLGLGPEGQHEQDMEGEGRHAGDDDCEPGIHDRPSVDTGHCSRAGRLCTINRSLRLSQLQLYFDAALVCLEWQVTWNASISMEP